MTAEVTVWRGGGMPIVSVGESTAEDRVIKTLLWWFPLSSHQIWLYLLASTPSFLPPMFLHFIPLFSAKKPLAPVLLCWPWRVGEDPRDSLLCKVKPRPGVALPCLGCRDTTFPSLLLVFRSCCSVLCRICHLPTSKDLTLAKRSSLPPDGHSL